MMKEAFLNQAAPVQNTWYSVLNCYNSIIYEIEIYVADTAETLELRVTVDGNAFTLAQAAVAATGYYFNMGGSVTTGFVFTITATDPLLTKAFHFYGRTVLVELRKTTATGAGNLRAMVLYGCFD